MSDFIIHYRDRIRQTDFEWRPCATLESAKQQAKSLEDGGNRIIKIVDNGTGREINWR